MTATILVVCPFYFCGDPIRKEITRRVFKHYALMTNITFIVQGP